MKALLVVGFAFVTCAGVAQQPAPLTKSADRLIDDLDHPRWRVRRDAFDELRRLGDAALPALQEALRNVRSDDVGAQLITLLAMRKPSEFDADFNGWHMVYSTIVHAQTFEATGATLKLLQLRVAQLSATRPVAPLDIEIRDKKLQTIYMRGAIDPAVAERDFRWQAVRLKQYAPLKVGETYALVFHSRNNKNTSPWAINTIYKDIYPHGHHWYSTHQDMFFHIEYQEGTSVRVGPKTDDVAKMKTPINSGATGGTHVEDGGGLRLQSFGMLPAGRLMEPER